MRQAVKSEGRRCNSATVRRRKIHPRQMFEKSRNAVFSRWFVCQVSPKVGLLKRRVRREVLRGDIKNSTPLWRKSTFWSENVQNTSAPKHFLLFSRRKNARRCGEKHMWPWKCTKHEVFGTLLYVQMSKNARRCGEKHMWQWKCTKHEVFGALLYVQMSKNGTPLWRKSTCGNENVQNTSFREHFWKFWCRKNARRCGEMRILKWKCTKHGSFGALFEVLMSKN